jgi:hypothetical protein
MNDDELHRPLTRDDFDNLEDWYRYCHGGGIEPFDPDKPFGQLSGNGFYGSLAGAIYGHTRREFQRAWEEWGKGDHIEFDDLKKAYRAVAFANCLGRIMSSRLDITWSTVGVAADLAVAARQRDFLDWMRRWLDRHAGWAAYLWVLERGSQRGVHTHLLFYLPPGMGKKFRTDASRALERVVGCKLVDRPREKTLRVRARGQELAAQWYRFAYMMKGLDPHTGWRDADEQTGIYTYAKRVGLRTRSTGMIEGKRVGVSRALDDASFRRWREVNEFPDMVIRRAESSLLHDGYYGWFQENRDRIVQPAETRNGNRPRETETSISEETEIEAWNSFNIR